MRRSEPQVSFIIFHGLKNGTCKRLVSDGLYLSVLDISYAVIGTDPDPSVNEIDIVDVC